MIHTVAIRIDTLPAMLGIELQSNPSVLEGAPRGTAQDRKPEVSAFILVISGVLAEVNEARSKGGSLGRERLPFGVFPVDPFKGEDRSGPREWPRYPFLVVASWPLLVMIAIIVKDG